MDRVALYARVSTAEQTEGHSIDAQIESLRAYAAERAWVVVNEFIDPGFSGDVPDRPALTALLEAARRGLFDILLVYRLDRLARDVRLFLNTEHDLRQSGARLLSATEVVDDSHEGRLQLLIKSSFAQYEKAVIHQRAELGLVRAAKEGKWMGGMPPYGYDLDPKTSRLVVNDVEAKVVRQLFTWIVEEQLTLDRLQQRLNALGAPTKWESHVRPSTVNKPAFWHRRAISRILNRELYTGSYFYRKIKRPRGVPPRLATTRPESEWIPIPVPPLIDHRTFQLAQQQLRKNSLLARRRMHRSYPLRGLIRCGVCGRHWNGKPSEAIERYYICPGRFKSVTNVPCTAPSVAGHLLESLVWDQVRQLLLDPPSVLRRVQAVLRERDGAVAKEDQLRTVEAELEAVTRENSRLIDGYLVTHLTLDEFVKARTHAKLRITRLNDERERLAGELGALAATEAQLHSLEALAKNIRDLLPSLADDRRWKLLRQLVQQIVITGTTVEIHTIIPLADTTILQHELPTVVADSGVERHSQSEAPPRAPIRRLLSTSNSTLPVPLVTYLPKRYTRARPRRSYR